MQEVSFKMGFESVYFEIKLSLVIDFFNQIKAQIL